MEKSNLFLIEECEVINVEGIMKLENHCLTTTVGIYASFECRRIGQE